MPKPYNTLASELTGDNLFGLSAFGKSNCGVLCCDGTCSRLTRKPYSLKDKAEVMLPPQDMAYQMGEFGIKDPNGYALILGEDISKK